MFVIDISDPLTLVLLLAATLLLVFLAKELKKSYIAAIPLFAYLALIIMFGIQLLIVPDDISSVYTPVLKQCLFVDCFMIMVSFLSYLWIDDVDAKENKKKSIDNSLDWFWKKV